MMCYRIHLLSISVVGISRHHHVGRHQFRDLYHISIGALGTVGELAPALV